MESTVSLGDTSKGRKKTVSESLSMPIIQYTNEPKDILNWVTYYDCHYGPERHLKEKEKYNRKQEEGQNVDNPIHRQQRQQVLGSHKVNCGAHVECKEVFMYENENIVSSDGMDKSLKILELKKDIKGGKEVCTRKCINMKLPRVGAHSNHPIKSVGSLFHHIQPTLVDCISCCLDIGVTTCSDMKHHLKTYVLENVPNVSQEDASFFLSNITVSRQMYKVMMKLCHLKIDEVNVLKMIDLWKQDALADFIFFRPKMSSSDIQYADTEDDNYTLYHVPHGNEDVKNNLLLIHMTVAQKLLLQCYNNLVLMDTTYRTCRLMLLLFFLTVKTNVNYSPITSFIVQNEDTKSISEVLSRIKQYISLDGIDIKNFMIDCSPMEMQSIREVFPNCGLYLCDFHRNQCWGRRFRMTWLGISQHYELLMSTF